MAEHKVSGIDDLLFIDPANGTDYDTVVCLTSNSFKAATNVIDAASKCGPDKLPGTQDFSIDLEAISLYDPTTGTVSEGDIYSLLANKTTVSWKMGKASPVTGDVTYAGSGFFSDFQRTSSDTDAVSFTASLQIKGTPTKTTT